MSIADWPSCRETSTTTSTTTTTTTTTTKSQKKPIKGQLKIWIDWKQWTKTKMILTKLGPSVCWGWFESVASVVYNIDVGWREVTWRCECFWCCWFSCRWRHPHRRWEKWKRKKGIPVNFWWKNISTTNYFRVQLSVNVFWWPGPNPDIRGALFTTPKTSISFNRWLC